jgi:hypothetical protein
MTNPQVIERRRIQREHADDDNLILSIKEWCALNNFSLRTGGRILAGSDGPVVTRLSARRIGITRKNNAKWQAARSQRSAGAAS